MGRFKLRTRWEDDPDSPLEQRAQRAVTSGSPPKMMIVYDFVVSAAINEICKLCERRWYLRDGVVGNELALAHGIFYMVLLFFPYFTQWNVVNAHVNLFDPHTGDRSATRGGEVTMTLASALLLGAIYNLTACITVGNDEFDNITCSATDAFLFANRFLVCSLLVITAMSLSAVDRSTVRTWFGVMGAHSVLTSIFFFTSWQYTLRERQPGLWPFQVAAGIDVLLPACWLLLPCRAVPPSDTALWVSRFETLVKTGLGSIMLSGLRASFSTDPSQGLGYNMAGFSVAVYTLACKCLYFDNLRAPTKLATSKDGLWLSCWKHAHVPFVLSMGLLGVSIERYLKEGANDSRRLVMMPVAAAFTVWSSALIQCFCVDGSRYRFNKAVRLLPLFVAGLLLVGFHLIFDFVFVSWTVKLWLPGLLMLAAALVQRCLQQPLEPLAAPGPVEALLELSDGMEVEQHLGGDVPSSFLSARQPSAAPSFEPGALSVEGHVAAAGAEAALEAPGHV